MIKNTGYSTTPLLKKLGVKEGTHGMFINLPADLKGMTKMAEFSKNGKLTGMFDYLHIFATSQKSLTTEFTELKKHLKPDGMLWISWPKAGKQATDLNENIIRKIGLDIGLVDIKVAAIDDIWSGLKFVFRIKDRA